MTEGTLAVRPANHIDRSPNAQGDRSGNTLDDVNRWALEIQLNDAMADAEIHTNDGQGRCARCVRLGIDAPHPCDAHARVVELRARLKALPRDPPPGLTNVSKRHLRSV